jgi:hypothetical protein
MPGVRLLMRYNPLQIACVAAADSEGVGLKRRKPSSGFGLTTREAGSGGHGAG